MGHKFGNTLKRIVLWIVAVVLFLVIAIPCLLYVPAIQNWAKDLALKEVRKSTGMDISVGLLRLRFPLRLSLDDVSVVQPAGDTMVVARSLGVNVKVLPLFKGDIVVDGVELSSGRYVMGTPDSAMYIAVNVKDFRLDGGEISLSSERISVGRALLDGGDVTLLMKDTVVESAPDTAAIASKLRIEAREIVLRNVSYRMAMMPVIDSLGASVPSARLLDGVVDLGRHRVDARFLSVDSVSARYLTPSAEYLAEHPLRSESSDTVPISDADMWTVTADSVRLTGRSAVYAMRDAVPQPGLDFSYLQANDIYIAVDSFYNRGTSVTVPLRRLSGTERCGIKIDASGRFLMDSLLMRAEGFNIGTFFSRLRFDAEMGVGDLMARTDLPLVLKGSGWLSVADLRLAFPALVPMLRSLPAPGDILLDADIEGTSGSIEINRLSADLPRLVSIQAEGSINNPMDFQRMSGVVSLDGRLTDLNFMKPTLMDAQLGRELHLPPMTLKGTVDYSPGHISGDLTARTGEGRIALDADWQQRSEGYDLKLTADRFPVGSFMPSLGVGTVTAEAALKGRGYDPTAPKTDLHARVDVAEVVYLGHRYSDILLDAALHDCQADGLLVSDNPAARIDMDFTARFNPDRYEWELSGDVHNLDLQAMNLAAQEMKGSLAIDSKGYYAPKLNDIDASLDISDLDWYLPGTHLFTDALSGKLLASDSMMAVSVISGDMEGHLRSYCSLDTFIYRLGHLSQVIDSQIRARNVDVVAIQRSLPRMDVSLTAGTDNLINDYLAASKIGFRKAGIGFHNDSLMTLTSSVLGVTSGSTRIDTLSFDATQHGKYLVYKGAVENRPGTFDNFAHVNINGFIADDKMSLLLRQRNIKGEQGFMLGFNTTMTDSILTLRFVPYAPTIGYKKWTLNPDNFISFNFIDYHLDANLQMNSDKSYIHMFTEHDSGQRAADSSAFQEDVVVQLSRINLADWLSISPFAPPIKGELGADMRFRWDARQLTGKGNLDISELYYGRDRVGTFTVGLDVRNSANGTLRADASLFIDSVKVITAQGSLNDSTLSNPFLLDFSMIHLPLRIVNPFLPKNIAQLSGVLNGQMEITGTMIHPVFNGYLDFDSTNVRVGMLGSSFAFSEEKIPVDSNFIRFNDFSISGVNGKPLKINGWVDARDFMDIGMDLDISASDFQIVNSQRARRADVYGKASIDLNADVKGDMRWLNINARAVLLPGSNVTYVMTDAETALASQSTGDMVKFVQFSDTLQVNEADTISSEAMSMNLNAELVVSPGTTINVDLSADGQNKVTINGQGSLDFSMNPMNDGRMTGRFNINGGFVRYTPPMMSEKKFTFQEGSYVAFNGDMMNPILNIHAVDQMKANVTREGENSRLINFDVKVGLTNTFDNMNVSFDLSTPDDITVENELASMSPEQRANQAMNLLLYNIYTGPGTKANAGFTTNPLFSFLESQLNTWAANTIKGVDITFGIDQFNKTVDGASSSAMSYSYQVSKTLLNDRIKIIVGGNYTTDTNADENFSQNLINDISFEYMLNRSGSMYVRIFRHTGYESILEGEVTQTGVGFAIKKKINRLSDMFRWSHHVRRILSKPQTDEK